MHELPKTIAIKEAFEATIKLFIDCKAENDSLKAAVGHLREALQDMITVSQCNCSSNSKIHCCRCNAEHAMSATCGFAIQSPDKTPSEKLSEAQHNPDQSLNSEVPLHTSPASPQDSVFDPAEQCSQPAHQDNPDESPYPALDSKLKFQEPPGFLPDCTIKEE